MDCPDCDTFGSLPSIAGCLAIAVGIVVVLATVWVLALMAIARAEKDDGPDMFRDKQEGDE